MSLDSNNWNDREQLGSLVIKVPHWLVQVSIYDNSYNLVRFVNEFSLVDKEEDHYEASISLVPGIYEVVATMNEQLKRSLVRVKSGGKTEFALSNTIMESLFIESVISDENVNDGASDKIVEACTPYKRKASENSNLFLRLTVPITSEFSVDDYTELFGVEKVEYHKHFYDLIKIVTKIDIKIFKERAEIILDTDLRAGFYVIEWMNTKKEKFHQSVYLHSGYSTQVFLKINTKARDTFYMRIAKLGAFPCQTDDEEIAAKTILATLNLESRHSLMHKDNMKELLSKELKNPWLGVLAAYAIIPDISAKIDKPTQDIRDNLLDKILIYLQKTLPDHPDVNALFLNRSMPAQRPFFFPPLLFKGLCRAKKHAEIFSTTIPEASFTSVISQAKLMDTPWVNWTALQVSDLKLQIRSGFGLFQQDSQMHNSKVTLRDIMSPKVPSFKLTSDVPDISSTPGDTTWRVTNSFSTLEEFSLVNTMQTITENNYYSTMPNVYTNDSYSSLFKSIDINNTNKIASAVNLPFSNVNIGIESLLEKENDFKGSKLSNEEQLILKYAILENGDYSKKGSLSNNKNASGEIPENGLNSTLEDCVARIEDAAKRILMGFENKDSTYLPAGKNIVSDLREISIETLKRADFIIVTSSDGKTVYFNGAFIRLISSEFVFQNITDSIQKGKIKRSNLYKWQKSLEELPLGKSALQAPFNSELFEFWEVKRSGFKEGNEKKINGFINILRGKNSKYFLPSEIEKIVDIISVLEVYAPLYALDAAENINSNDYSDKLVDIVSEFRKILLQPT